MHTWLRKVRGNCLTVIEIGSGMFVPSVRTMGESIVKLSGHKDSCLVRINPIDFDVHGKNDISVPLKGLEALTVIDKLLNGDDL